MLDPARANELDEGPAAPSPRPGASRHGPVLIGLAVVAIVLVVGFTVHWWTVGRFLESTNNAYLRADSVIIAPKIGGYVQAVLVGDNQRVTAGQPLLRIDETQYRAALDMAEADVAQKHADLTRFAAEIERQQAMRAQATAQLAVAEAAARFAVSDAARFDRLQQTGAASLQRREQAAAMRDQAMGQANAARAALDTAAREMDVLKAQIQQGQAALRAAEARVRSARDDLDGSTILAPAAGRVGDRTVRAGQYVQPGSRLMTIVPEDLYLVANFKETQVGHMRKGQKVSVSVDALPGQTIAGVIDSLAPGTGADFALLPAENATGNFTKIVQRVPVRIHLRPDAGMRDSLRSGLSAEVEVNTKSGDAE